MTTSEPVLVEQREGVVVLTLNEPDRRNPMTPEIIAGLTQQLTAAAASDTCRVVVLRGAGRGFCSGADLSRMQDTTIMRDRNEYEAILDLNRLLWNYPKPTVAAVHGFALGGGCSLMVWCDFTIVEEGSKIGFPEIVAGMPSATVIPTLLRTVGRKATLELTLTGARIDIHRAVDLGLISQAVAPGTAFDVAMEIATSVASRNPTAARLTKEIINTVADVAYGPALTYAKDVRVIARADPDFSVDFSPRGDAR